MITIDCPSEKTEAKRITIYIRDSDIIFMSGVYQSEKFLMPVRAVRIQSDYSFEMFDTKDNYDKVLKTLNE